MIEIKKKSNCCGCFACAQICPKQCIKLNNDSQGFLYPCIDKNICIDCHLCEKVCPKLCESLQRSPKSVYAAFKDDDNIRLGSSSGGVFYSLAEYTIKNGGLVFGAAFDIEWQVQHIFVDKIDDIKLLQTSKYVQSRIENTYKEAKLFLEQGRKVLFTGTSCQILGLKNFLRHDYDNLLAVEVICHGVPSPMIWRKYLNQEINSALSAKRKSCSSYLVKKKYRLNSVKSINFRDKRDSWTKYGFVLSIVKPLGEETLLFSTRQDNIFMRGFLNNFYLRPSCYDCPAKKGKSQCDLSLADFWEIWHLHPEMPFDDKGTSLVLAYSEKGKDVLKKIDVTYAKTTYDKALMANPSIESCHPYDVFCTVFWYLYKIIGLKSIQITYIIKRFCNILGLYK